MCELQGSSESSFVPRTSDEISLGAFHQPITDATEVLVALVQLAALLVVVIQGTATILMAQRMMSGGDCWHVWKCCLRYNLRSYTSLFGQKH